MDDQLFALWRLFLDFCHEIDFDKVIYRLWQIGEISEGDLDSQRESKLFDIVRLRSNGWNAFFQAVEDCNSTNLRNQLEGRLRNFNQVRILYQP